MEEILNSNGEAGLAHRRERGIEAYARIFDLPEEDVPDAMAGRVGRVFAEEALLSAGGPAWFHPALSARERSIAVITALAAQGAAGDRLDSHIRLAKHNGLDYPALSTLMTLITIYIGQAYGSQSMEAVQRIPRSGSPANEPSS